jgi:hypothetical protein
MRSSRLPVIKIGSQSILPNFDDFFKGGTIDFFKKLQQIFVFIDMIFCANKKLKTY